MFFDTQITTLLLLSPSTPSIIIISYPQITNMSEITLANSLREKMLRDEVAYTLSVKLVRSVELPMMAKTSGFDGILIDMEHSSFDLDTTSEYICLLVLTLLIDRFRSTVYCSTLRRHRANRPRSFQRLMVYCKSTRWWRARRHCSTYPLGTRCQRCRCRSQIPASRSPVINKQSATLPISCHRG